MKKLLSVLTYSALLGVLSASASLAYAQTSGSGALNTQPIANLSNSVIGIINTVVVPVVFAIAFIVFLWGVFTYFIAGGAQEEKRQEGARFVFSAIIGLVVMISIWGLVNLVGSSLPNMVNRRPDLPTFGPAESTTGANSAGTHSNKGAQITPTAPNAPKNTVNPTPASAQPVPCPSGNCIPGTNIPSNLEGLY